MSAAFAVALAASAATAEAALTEGARLAAIYDTILEARFDEAEEALAGHACPPAPTEACRVLEVASAWWRIQMDPQSRRLDAELERRASIAIAATEAWTDREPDRGEAWFYRAGARAPLVQWQVLRGERLAAARQGAAIKAALERALELDPSLDDAYFGIGLYHYYAGAAPAAARMLRWLLMLPGGDRERGLAEMVKARERGVLMQGEADYQLHWIYLWYEKEPTAALDLLRGLDARYPSNPVFLRRIAEVQAEYFQDHAASAAAWERLLDRAKRGAVAFAPLAETAARLGLATELLALSRPGSALDHLNAVIAQRSSAPYGADALAHLRLGRAYEEIGRRDLAADAYNRAITRAPRGDPGGVRERARVALRALRRRE